MLTGTGIICLGAAVGWAFGHYELSVPVRAINWWLTRVILPRLRKRSWSRRTATIFVNNTTVLATMVALGVWPTVGLAAVAVLGVNLGIALRVLARLPDDLLGPEGATAPSSDWRMTAGVALNLLEVPAIVATLGLSIGYKAVFASAGQAWQIFGLWIAPVLLIAAAGEAMWLGVARRSSEDDRSGSIDPLSCAENAGEPDRSTGDDTLKRN